MTLTQRVVGVLAAAVVALAGCAAGGSAQPAERVELPPGSVPEVLAEADGVLVGHRRDDRPGLLRLTPDGQPAEVPLSPATGYGATASWYALTAEGGRILGVGGDRGGAHGNVRWSVWTGDAGGVAERVQAFSTFGGWGAGDLVGAVFASGGPLLVGSWESAQAGNDVMVWTAAGDEWSRVDVAGTPLESTRTTLNFAVAATRAPGGALVTGWQAGASGQKPAVWRQVGGSWQVTPLPDGGRAGIALAARCGPAECAVAGRVDGRLALWRFVGDRWERVAGVPEIPLGEREPVAAPLIVSGGALHIAADGDRVRAIEISDGGVTTRAIADVRGPVRALVASGADAYVIAGEPAQLWRLPELLG